MRGSLCAAQEACQGRIGRLDRQERTHTYLIKRGPPEGVHRTRATICSPSAVLGVPDAVVEQQRLARRWLQRCGRRPPASSTLPIDRLRSVGDARWPGSGEGRAVRRGWAGALRGNSHT